MNHIEKPVVRKTCLLLLATLAIAGCQSKPNKSQQQPPVKPLLPQCAAGDTPEVCKTVQECFASGTSIEVCRLGESDAMRSSKDLGPAYDGAADALNHDSAKPAKKPATQPQKR